MCVVVVSMTIIYYTLATHTHAIQSEMKINCSGI